MCVLVSGLCKSLFLEIVSSKYSYKCLIWFLQVQEISCAMSEVLEHPEEGSKHQLKVSEMRRRPEAEVQQLVGLSLPLHTSAEALRSELLCAEMNL